jgi:hypothetical protein
MKLRLCLFIGLTLLLPSCLGASISVAVKRGQTKVDAKELPFASFTVSMVNGSLSLQKIVLVDVANGKEISAQLEHSFSSKLDYLTAMDGNRCLHAQIILPLKPGDYEFKRIEFNIPRAGQLGEAAIEFEKIGHFRFKVSADAVNYCGSIVIATDWARLQGMRVKNGRDSVEGSFGVNIATEKTQARDAKWARDVVPALRDLPSVVSAIEHR